MSSAHDPTARLRAGLNPLLTASLGVYHNQNSNSTPLSGISMSSHNPFSSTHTPVSAMQPYNPQEWVAPPATGPDRSHQFQEPQVTPPPPPPYSPPRSQRPASMAFDSTQAASIAATALSGTPPPLTQRISPERPPAATSFPPPPNGRGGSRDRRFGLPSLSRRRDVEQASTPVEVHSPHPLANSSRSVMQPSHHPSHPGPLTLQIPIHRPEADLSNLPPGARRAVSTPAAASPLSPRSRSSSQIRWGGGMPVPPPPPGPPPSSSRSQSVNRVDFGSEPITSPPTRRPPPSGVAALGPIPPTPADWTDNGNHASRGPSPERTPVVETPSTSSALTHTESGNSSTASSGLTRQHAVRGEKTLRERRNESRTRGVRDSIDASISNQPLSDIVIPAGSNISKRLTVNNGPRSSGKMVDTPGTAGTGSSSDHSMDSKGSTPRALMTDASSPPFSPRPRKASNPYDRPPIAPKALPTPPTQSRASSQSEMRQTSETIVPTPLSPGRALTKQVVVGQTTDQFTRGTIERFKLFAHNEAAATDDAERVRLFAEFFVTESRIRRERYSTAIGAMGSEVLDLTRDLFRPMPAVRRESTNSVTSGVELTPRSADSRSHRGSIGSSYGINTPGTQTNPTPTSTSLPGSSPVTGPGNPNWQGTNYMPSLSPILSMSVSDAVDEEDSRGRPPSRWWEADSSEAPSTRIERSRRESKYMSVPKEAREALQWEDNPGSAPGPSKRTSDEYPTEKSGWHESPLVDTPQANHRHSIQSVSTPNTPTPNPAHLDVSRLVTLPPPYPRHHPAVNNNHPDLAHMRTSVRALSDMTEVEAIKTRFQESSTKARSDAAEEVKKERQAMRANLQQEIASGNIGYAEAAAIEADMRTAEDGKITAMEKEDFEAFQAIVVVPLNDLLTSRIEKATTMFDELRSRLFVETAESNPNLPQEEGDEQPELLEKLTLLKWIFEAREILHKAVYDLLTDRNDRYCELVCTPYRLAKSTDKLNSAKAFFAEDGAKRALAYFDEVLRRTQEFRDVVEENVVRGVEVQLSAFWDIAPLLKRVLDKIPADVGGFQTQIPASEFDENPSYVDHPLQYLFSLLLHAEKSTYQFIESQTNLLCLMHEVKEAVTVAKGKVMESEGRDAARVEEMRAEDMARLTDDLKDKVRVVQDQWKSALGDSIDGVKERVGGFLLETGGWDENFEEGGVGAL
ncbi:hypothetical protein GQ53DRAFT_681659 [Thozetella sp. PMI_491]|nr:hypothetical protein GQ53DRAFT_681659 [Thozetella sp. PMI_491]